MYRRVFVVGVVLMFSWSDSSVFAGSLAISEIFPNPSGNEAELEWIEIQNQGDETIDLAGWSIRDTAGSITTYYLPSIEIEKDAFYLIWRPISKIVLNNDSDGAELISPDEEIVSRTTYTNSKEDDSWCVGATSVWGWCSPTPGLMNSNPISATPNPSPTPQPSPSSSPSPSASPTVESKPTLPSSMIQLNEVSSCGPGNEWVEFRLTNAEQHSTTGYYIKELGGARRSLLPEYISGLHTLSWSSPILNNGGDTVFLYSPEDELLETVDIPKCASGTTWALSLRGEWDVSEFPTPGKENVFSEESLDQDQLFDEQTQTNATTAGEISKLTTTLPKIKHPMTVKTINSIIDQSVINSVGLGRDWIFRSTDQPFSQSTLARFFFYSSLLVFGSHYPNAVRRILDLVQ